MPASLVRTPSGGFVADITPADVVDRCDRCRQTYREGDWFCEHLSARHGHTIARLAVAIRACPSAAVTSTPATAFAPVFLAPET